MSGIAGLSASVTRILFLSGFPKELKTKDIQSAFAEWEGIGGGFKIKWLDDTSLLIVFTDPATAKRAYLNALANPPPILTSAEGVTAIIKPYDGADAQNVIQNVNNRHTSTASRSHNPRSASISVFPHNRGVSVSAGAPPPNFRGNNGANGVPSIPEYQNHNNKSGSNSPTLPNLPTQPTLNALINSSLGGEGANNGLPADPAILASSDHHALSGPRIGDPGKRMLGAALGVRHPGLPPRMANGNGMGVGVIVE
ncbi:hypothetical protein CYLTODRAFT_417111 [Cylindrobasidium torrendii FP15055 ss-10]|uniref:RRM domain-containing protein n=1 Tax=Cylindrobasidium torrendii FP15055 ss-10 TaxID=1314674 RepID=A0A0D7BUZ3_9AGAR|nr:hypothetical protein CYLTODRAFT_417111 [Cylindrobasidium torrendii FP15055 ss-10]